MFQSLYAFILLSSLVMVAAQQHNPSPNPYLTTTTILNHNYQKMVKTFKVFIYNEPNQTQSFKFGTEPESLFYSSLHNSTYLTKNAEEAHMFFLPFSHHTSTRSLARLITRIRNDFPYWNRTLGADHFYLSCSGIPREADRNLVELKKNAVQISCFPTPRVRFVPHKDITLPPIPDFHAPVRTGGAFCVGEYGNVSWVAEALRSGCVPVVVAEAPVNDMLFRDVLRWSEMVVFVGSEEGVKRVMGEIDTWRERYERMRRLGVVASRHLLWNHPPVPLDAFNTIMYQLWLRRHTIRYTSTQ